jgi:hypothetical protein
VDAVRALFDDRVEFLYSRLSPVIELTRRSRPEATRADGRRSARERSPASSSSKGQLTKTLSIEGADFAANRQSSARGSSARTTRRTSSKEIEAPLATGLNTGAPVTRLRPSVGARLDWTLRAAAFFLACAFIAHTVSADARTRKDLTHAAALGPLLSGPFRSRRRRRARAARAGTSTIRLFPSPRARDSLLPQIVYSCQGALHRGVRGPA